MIFLIGAKHRKEGMNGALILCLLSSVHASKKKYLNVVNTLQHIFTDILIFFFFVSGEGSSGNASSVKWLSKSYRHVHTCMYIKPKQVQR